MSTKIKNIILAVYKMFNARDVDGVLPFMSPDVVWANGMEGGSVVGKKAVREYWGRQWELISPTVTPDAFNFLGENSVDITARQVIVDRAGAVVSDSMVLHIFTITTDGLIASMQIGQLDHH